MQIFLGIPFLINSYFCGDKKCNVQPQAVASKRDRLRLNVF